MTGQHYPEDLVISAQDFADSGWKEAIALASREGYPAMWQALSAAARNAIEQGRNEHGKALWLLANACSMMLSPSSPNEPFRPLAVFHDRRSVIPDDLSDGDITFFAQIVDAVDDPLAAVSFASVYRIRAKLEETAFFFDGVLPVNGNKTLTNLGMTHPNPRQPCCG
ncbi:MAG: DUF7380 domain-containing protein [Desulfobulbus sp.]|jgi:hypothetical protein